MRGPRYEPGIPLTSDIRGRNISSRTKCRTKCNHVFTIKRIIFETVSRRDPENREKRQKLFKNINRNALYELPNQKSSFRTNQIPSYNVNVDVNETGNSPYARENMPRESMPSRLVPSRTQRVGTKRGQPAEKPIENNDAKRVSSLMMVKSTLLTY